MGARPCGVSLGLGKEGVFMLKAVREALKCFEQRNGMTWFTLSQDRSSFLLRIGPRNKGWSQHDQLEAIVVIDRRDEEDLDQDAGDRDMEAFSTYVGGRADGTSQ